MKKLINFLHIFITLNFATAAPGPVPPPFAAARIPFGNNDAYQIYNAFYVDTPAFQTVKIPFGNTDWFQVYNAIIANGNKVYDSSALFQLVGTNIQQTSTLNNLFLLTNSGCQKILNSSGNNTTQLGVCNRFSEIKATSTSFTASVNANINGEVGIVADSFFSVGSNHATITTGRYGFWSNATPGISGLNFNGIGLISNSDTSTMIFNIGTDPSGAENISIGYINSLHGNISKMQLNNNGIDFEYENNATGTQSNVTIGDNGPIIFYSDNTGNAYGISAKINGVSIFNQSSDIYTLPTTLSLSQPTPTGVISSQSGSTNLVMCNPYAVPQASAPASFVGELWLDTSSNQLKIFVNGAWHVVPITP